MLTFPQLSRQPAISAPEETVDPTLRDTYENGMESTRAKFTRRRRTFDITIEHLTPADKRRLDRFVEKKAVFGANIFLFRDDSDPQYPENLRVRFSKLPSYPKAQWVQEQTGAIRKTATFQIKEV